MILMLKKSFCNFLSYYYVFDSLTILFPINVYTKNYFHNYPNEIKLHW